MFSTKTNEKNLTKVSTIVGPETTIEGRLTVDSSIRIDGKVYGEIKCGGDVTIGKDGLVEHTIYAKNVYIAGKVKGNIKVDEKVHVFDSGQLNGNVEMKTFIIDENGHFSGKSLMKGKQGKVTSKSRIIEMEKNKDLDGEYEEQPKKLQEQ